QHQTVVEPSPAPTVCVCSVLPNVIRPAPTPSRVVDRKVAGAPNALCNSWSKPRTPSEGGIPLAATANRSPAVKVASPVRKFPVTGGPCRYLSRAFEDMLSPPPVPHRPGNHEV